MPPVKARKNLKARGDITITLYSPVQHEKYPRENLSVRGNGMAFIKRRILETVHLP